MLWNDLNYDLQLKVYACIEEALLKQKDESIQDAIILALKELEVWDNSPCPIIEEHVNAVDSSSYSIPPKLYKQVVKQTNCDCKFPWLCRCLFQEKSL
jgi:hypothetical protein